MFIVAFEWLLTVENTRFHDRSPAERQIAWREQIVAELKKRDLVLSKQVGDYQEELMQSIIRKSPAFFVKQTNAEA